MEGSFKGFENAHLLDKAEQSRIKKELAGLTSEESLSPPEVLDVPQQEEKKTEIQDEMFIPAEMTDIPKPFTAILKRDSTMNRREVLEKGANTGLAVVALGVMGMNTGTKKEGDVLSNNITFNIHPSPEDMARPDNRPVVGEFDMGKLAGRGIGDIFADYVGLAEERKKAVEEKRVLRVPEKLFIDFHQVVCDVWTRKIDFVGRKKPAWLDNTRMAKKVYGDFYSQKETRHFPSMEQYVEKVESIIRDTEKHLDWEAMPELKGFEFGDIDKLTQSDVVLIKELSEKISGSMVVAYFLTELMPARDDHKANINMYEFLLKNAGEELINCSPALYDAYLSVGPGQPTSFAVYDMGGNEVRGASLMNKLLPKDKRMPGSVVKLLTTEYQVKAAYLFAIHNLAKLIVNFRKMEPEKTAGRIHALGQASPIAILQYIASAHHNPGDAIKAFRAWIDKGYQGSHAVLAKNTINYYIRKSYGGYQELRKQLHS